MRLAFIPLAVYLLTCLSLFSPNAQAQYVQLSQEFDFEILTQSSHEQFINQKRSEIKNLISPFRSPPKAKVLVEEPEPWEVVKNPWRRGVIASVFWIGEKVSERNPTSNNSSAWDANWKTNYGGEDHPAHRNGYLPKKFTPKLNPFYIALPYNDLAPDGEHYPEASKIIPWFWTSYRSSWVSVCKGRWLALHYKGKVCYAQWEDCGPYFDDDWQYVFKGKKPKPSQYGNAGIEISPAIRDFLGIRSGYRVSWKFVDFQDVPLGPWQYRYQPAHKKQSTTPPISQE